MKRIVLTSLAVISQLAVTGCDSREKDVMTIELAFKSDDGKEQNLTRDCKQTQSHCLKDFEIETANGKENVYVGVLNDPTPENIGEARRQLQNVKVVDVDKGVYTLSEYSQKIFVGGLNVKDVTDIKVWKARSTRKETYDVIMRDGKKLGTGEVKVY